MNRILGMVVAVVGLLAFSSAASAATVVFNVTGSGSSWSKSGDANAASPGAPDNGGPCIPGLASVGYPTADPLINCFRYTFQGAGVPADPAGFAGPRFPPSPGANTYPQSVAGYSAGQFAAIGAGGTPYFPAGFATGSSVSLDITGSAVTMLGGTLNLYAVTPILYDTAILTTIGVVNIAGGATGTLTGDTILWSSPANVSFKASINCFQPTPASTNCTAISHPMVPIPFDPYYSAITGTTAATALNLGEWDLDALHTTILASSNAINRWGNDVLNPNRRAGAYIFGATSLGNPVPEPGTAALILLGLGALALRSRKA